MFKETYRMLYYHNADFSTSFEMGFHDDIWSILLQTAAPFKYSDGSARRPTLDELERIIDEYLTTGPCARSVVAVVYDDDRVVIRKGVHCNDPTILAKYPDAQ